MRLLRTLFAGSTAAAPADEIETALEQLVAAKQERDRRAGAVAEIAEHLGRVKQVLDDSAAADAALRMAEAQAAAASQAWAAGGAKGEPNGDAFEAAQQVRVVADRLRLKAQGATAAVPALRESQTDARRQLEKAEDAIRAAAIAVLRAEAAPDFELLERVMPEVTAALYRLKGLRVLTASWGKGHMFGGWGGGGDMIAERLGEIGFPEPDGFIDSLAKSPQPTAEMKRAKQSAAEWLRRARELAQVRENAE